MTLQNAPAPQSALLVHATGWSLHWPVDGSQMSGSVHSSVLVQSVPTSPCGWHVSPRHVSPLTQFASTSHEPPGVLSTQLPPVRSSQNAPFPHSACVVQPVMTSQCEVSGL